MARVRKTIDVEWLRATSNRAIREYANIGNTEAAYAIGLALGSALMKANRYRGFRYVDADGEAVPADDVRSGLHYEDRRYYM